MNGLNLDERIFLALNGDLGNFADSLFWFASGIMQWLPLYLLILFFIYKRFGLRVMIWSLVIISLSVIAADQVCNLFKYGVKKLRPSHDPDLEGLVYTLKGYRGGLYGTFSAHAATCAAIAAYTARLFRSAWYTAAICLWVVFVSYSRIYLGVHFPLDLILGAATGYIFGSLGFWAFKHKVCRT